MTVPVLVYGTGGMGREAAQCVRDLAALSPPDFQLVGFVDDRAHGRIVHGLPVWLLADAPKDAAVVVGVGDPSTRARLAERVVASGRNEATLVHPSAIVGASVNIGSGCYVAPAAVLTCDLALGRQVQVNVGTVVHHDCVVGDFVTLSPRVTLCGGVRVGRGAFLGAGAVVRQDLTIGEDAVVGIGAVVTKNIPAGEMWVGNPARPLASRG